MRLKKMIQVFSGTIIMGVAISLIIHGKYGSDTLSVFILGLMNKINIPFGIWSMIINIVVILISLVYAREQLGYASIVNALGIGTTTLILEPYANLVSTINHYDEAILFLGPIIFGVGSALYVAGNRGSAGLECLTLMITERVNLSLKYVRILIDATFVIVGVLLGASLGIGTLLCVLMIGPVMEYTLKMLQSREKKNSSEKADLPASY